MYGDRTFQLSGLELVRMAARLSAPLLLGSVWSGEQRSPLSHPIRDGSGWLVAKHGDPTLHSHYSAITNMRIAIRNHGKNKKHAIEPKLRAIALASVPSQNIGKSWCEVS